TYSDSASCGSSALSLFQKHGRVGAHRAQCLRHSGVNCEQAHSRTRTDAAVEFWAGALAEIIARLQRLQGRLAVPVVRDYVDVSRLHKVVIAPSLARRDNDLARFIQNVPDRSALVHARIHDIATKNQSQPPVEHEADPPRPTRHAHGEHNETPSDPRQETGG